MLCRQIESYSARTIGSTQQYMLRAITNEDGIVEHSDYLAKGANYFVR